MQLLAKFKKILYMGFRATLKFRNVKVALNPMYNATVLYMGFRATLIFLNFKVALNPMYRIFLNFAKSCMLSRLSKVDNIKKFHRAIFEL